MGLMVATGIAKFPDDPGDVIPVVLSPGKEHLLLQPAFNIPGWMEADELIWLADQASRHKVIVEIGSFIGRSTAALAANSPGVVYAVDDFVGPRDVTWDGTPPDFYELFTKNVAQFDNVVPVKSDHKSAVVPLVPDMVFIDGSHEYLDVVRDIRTWYPRLANGGLFCGHDIQLSDVMAAAQEHFGCVQIASNTTIWFVRKPESSGTGQSGEMIKTLFR